MFDEKCKPQVLKGDFCENCMLQRLDWWFGHTSEIVIFDIYDISLASV